MTDRTAKHASFTVERLYPATPQRVFAAWADPEAKKKWNYCHGEWQTTRHEIDFRVGGEERLDTRDSDGVIHGFVGHYHDIVEGRRIVYSYGMHLDDRRISVSLVTLEIRPEGSGTRLSFTEQGVFLDGYEEIADRELGTAAGMDNLGAFLASPDHVVS